MKFLEDQWNSTECKGREALELAYHYWQNIKS